MELEQPTIVRVHCGCGQRFRVRNARAGAGVRCPKCQRPLLLSQGDLRLAAGGETIALVPGNDGQPAPARLLDAGELRPARSGSRPGATGGTTYASPAAGAEAAVSGWRTLPAAGVEREPPPPPGVGYLERSRAFLRDLVAGFWLAGRVGNLWSLGGMVLGIGVLVILVWLTQFIVGFFAFLAALLVWGVTVAYVVQFFWQTLQRTAGGEEDIPLVQADWDLFDDVLRPLVWMLLTTGLTCFPAWLVLAYGPEPIAHRQTLAVLTLIITSLLWPIAVMSMAIGQSFVFLRPDWLLRALVGIGPVYLVAWAQCVLVGGAFIFVYVVDVSADWPLLARLAYAPASLALLLYLGYIFFRSLGLLYRHFQDRLPWQF